MTRRKKKVVTPKRKKVTKRKSFFEQLEENNKNNTRVKKIFQLSSAPVPSIFLNKTEKKKQKKKRQPTKGKWDNRKVTNKLRREQPFGDYDRDKVPNYRDCQPYDKNRHGVEPTELMEERMATLPIYVTDEILSDTPNVNELIEEGKAQPFLSSEARSYAPLARKMALSMIKRYPDLISEIKRKKPSLILITSQPHPEGKSVGIAHPSFKKRGLVVIYGIPEKYISKVREGELKDVRKPTVAFAGGTLRHELEHIRQFKETKHKSASRKKLFKGEYEKQPGEREAFKAERRLHEKHLKERPEEETLEFVRREFDEERDNDTTREFDNEREFNGEEENEDRY